MSLAFPPPLISHNTWSCRPSPAEREGVFMIRGFSKPLFFLGSLLTARLRLHTSGRIGPAHRPLRSITKLSSFRLQRLCTMQRKADSVKYCSEVRTTDVPEERYVACMYVGEQMYETHGAQAFAAEVAGMAANHRHSLRRFISFDSLGAQ